MECYNCGAELTKEDFCPDCGIDVSVYKKIIRTANLCYNEGLARAFIRDLTGAAEYLKACLRYNKNHKEARNLLGLIYFEMGETVEALSQWVISKNLHPRDNIAARYLDEVQKNPAKLEAVNLTIKKYNQALTYCRQNSCDLAVIQLKKVLSLNPKLVKGHQLLALYPEQKVRSGEEGTPSGRKDRREQSDHTPVFKGDRKPCACGDGTGEKGREKRKSAGISERK